jgi:uncharacterized membrane protein YjjP (DUF1212 family)
MVPMMLLVPMMPLLTATIND